MAEVALQEMIEDQPVVAFCLCRELKKECNVRGACSRPSLPTVRPISQRRRTRLRGATGQEFAKSRGLHLFGIRSLTQRTDALLQDNAPAMVPHGLGHPPSRKRVVHL